MNINSTSSYVNNASSSNGFSGLASGIDTESLVEKMLAGTQAKIDKQNGLKQQVEWKQEIYREIISQINSFQSQFFGSSSATNFLNQAFFNAMKAITSSNAFKVNATSSAATGNVDLEVRQLATNTSITSGASVSGKLAGTVDIDALKGLVDEQLKGDYNVELEVDGKKVKVDLKDVFVDKTKGTFKTYSSTAERDAALQTKLDEAFKDSGVTVNVKGGAVSFTSTDGKAITVSKSSGEMGLQRLGLTAGARSEQSKDGKSATLSGKINDKPTVSFSVTLDNLQKEIKMDLRNIVDENGNVAISKFKDELQAGLDKAHGKGQIKAEFNGDNFELKVSAGRKVMVGGSKEVLDAMGVKNGQSNRIGMGGSLKDLYFANGLQGTSFKFTINDVEFSFNENDTMSDIISTINRSGAGVRMVYRVQDDTFTLESSESGAGRTITMSQEEGNLLNALFGSGVDGMEIKTGNKAVSGSLTFGKIDGKPGLAEGKTVKEGKFTINVNGADHTFSIPRKGEGEEGYTKAELIEELNTQMDKAFGAGNINLDENGSLVVNNGAKVTIKSEVDANDPEAVLKAAEAGDLNAAFFGGEEVSNVATGDTTLAQMGLDGLYAADGTTVLSEETKLSELAEKTGGRLSFEDGRIVATNTDGKPIGTADNLEKLFGTSDLKLGVATGEAATLKEGQNAVVKIDGVLTERSTNTFQVNGLDISLTGTTGSYVKGKMLAEPLEFPPEGAFIKDGKLHDAATGKVLLDANGNERTFPAWPKFLDSSGKEVAGAAGMDKDGYLLGSDGNRLTDSNSQEIKGFVDMTSVNNYRFVDENGKEVAGAVGIDKDGYLLDSDGNRIFNGTADKIEVTRNTDQIVDGVKQFIDGYNKLIKTLNDYIGEETTYRKYDPLTEAQKKEMSEKEIELWEEKAKQGLLHNDSTISSFLQAMRTAMYEKPAGSDYALYDLGIETGDWESKGQLVLSADGEARLRQMLESDPAGVMKLFTDTEEGLAVKLNSIIDKTAKISSGSPGSLVQLAGVKGKASEANNTLYNRLKAIDDKIATLKRAYEKEKARYWNQFNSMEKVIANMNSQSSWLTQQLG